MNIQTGTLDGKVPGPGMRWRLRQVTNDLHLSVERHFDLPGRHWTRDSYRRLLERLWGFHAPLEVALARLDWQGTVIVPGERCKRAWLEADMLHLGMNPASIAGLEMCHNLPAIRNMHDGLGALYVLEGSTLGGQVILRALQTALNISPLAGGRFFASHDKATGAMWRSYLDALEEAGAAPTAAGAIERAALATFTAFDRWFDEGHRT